LNNWFSCAWAACALDFILKKILFVAPPFTLAQPLGPTPSPLGQNPTQNGKQYLVLGVGYVGYANQVGVSKLGAGRCWLCWLSKTNRQQCQHHAAVRAQRFAGGWRLLAMLAVLTPVLNRSTVFINLRHASC
jgi:hypothetical protein